MCGALLGCCRSLLPLGGRVCGGLSAPPFFRGTPRGDADFMRLATHCRDSWARHPRAPARMRPPLAERFLMDYFPCHLEGGPPLLPYVRRPRRAPPKSVPRAAPQRSRPPGAGSGTQGALCLERGAPSCARCRSLGWGISPCCQRATEGIVTPWRACVVRGSCPGLHRAGKCSSPRTGAQERRRCRRGLDAPALPLRPSRPRAPRHHAGAHPPLGRGAPSPPLHYGVTTPDPQNARRLTSLQPGGLGR